MSPFFKPARPEDCASELRMGGPCVRLTGAVECGSLISSQNKFGTENIKLTRTFHIQRRSTATGRSVSGMGLWVTALRRQRKWHEAMA